jgi:DNA-binding XRE family transcriptional regulator
MKPRVPPVLSPPARQVLELLAAQIETARSERRMSQQQLAERLGCSRFTVIAIERGEGTVAIGTVLEAAVILGVPLMADENRRVEAATTLTRSFLPLLPKRARPIGKVDDDF